MATTLGQVIPVDIKKAPVKTIKLLHRLIFQQDGDRGNRKRLKDFSGFEFEEESDEYKEKSHFVLASFLPADIACLATFLRLDHQGKPADLTTRILNRLVTLDFTNDDEEQEDDEEQDDDEEHDDRASVSSFSATNTAIRMNITENRAENNRPVSSGFMLSFRDVEDTLRDFNGSDNYPVAAWVADFEDMAHLFGWTDIQKFLFAKKCVKGLAKLFLQGEKDVTTWKKMKTALVGEFGAKVNSAKLHAMMVTRKMSKDESVQEYFLVMKELASRGNIEEEATIQYIIDGIPDEVNMKMTLYEATSLRELKKKLSVYDKYRSKIVSQQHRKPTSTSVPQPSGSRQRESSGSDSAKAMRKCYNCGETGHVASACPKPKKLGRYCFICHSPGHLKKDCPNHKDNNATSSKPAGRATDTSTNLVQQQDIVEAYTVQVGIDIFDAPIVAILDTGSPVSFIDYSFLPDKMQLKPYLGTQSFEGVNNSKIEILGILTQNVQVEGNLSVIINLYVVPSSTMKYTCLLGRDFIGNDCLEVIFGKKVEIRRKIINDVVVEVTDYNVHELLNINVCNETEHAIPNLNVNENLDSNIKSQVEEVVNQHYLVPERPAEPVTQYKLNLQLKPNAKPFYYNPRRLSFAEKEAVSGILDDLLQQGVIRPSNSEYCSPIVLVRKKNGQVRMAVDYRDLNKIIERHNFPIPHIDEQIDSLQNKRFYTKLDIRNAFHHVRVGEDSVKYTAFITFKGVFEYVGMPFGLSCGPAVFMKFIYRAFDKLLRENKILIYIDDILIGSETIEENLQILKEVLDIFVLNKLELRFDKCFFLVEEIQYLGYQISCRGICPGKENISAVNQYPIPSNFKQLRSYLGFISYFRKFIKDFAVRAKPFYELLKKETVFTWTERLTEIFNDFKKILVSQPVLSIYSHQAVTELHCDASSAGFGAILLQKQADGSFHPVCYYSKRTTDTESRLHSFELETLAIVYALERFRTYLVGVRFKIVTDCASVKAALERKEVNPRILRWSLALRNYDYELEHRAGTRLRHVDALSRNYSVSIINDNSFDRNLALLQDLDPDIQTIKQNLEIKEDKLYELSNGLVYRKHEGRLLFYVPSSMESSVMRNSHELMGHQGLHKTIEHLSRTYWFPNIRSKVHNYIKNCLKCISYTSIGNKVEGALHIPIRENIPFSTIHIDHYGPLERTGNKHKYVFEIKDAFTKFVKLYATTSTGASEVVKYLREYFRAYSKPRRIISDPGSAFTSTEYKDFLQDLGIQCVHTATATPKANGQIEVVNRSLTPILAKLMPTPKTWDKVLGKVEFAINNSINRSNGETPARMLFGIDQVGEVDDDVRQLLLEHQVVVRQLDRIREKGIQKLEKTDEYNKEYFDKRHKIPTAYKEGDYVMIRNYDTTPGVNKKLLPKYRGPYVVRTVLDKDRYIITDPDGHQLTQLPYRGVSSPENMRPWLKSE